ncbi:hypothetical protein F0562_013316 [Nyssa sinensis]|uniref:Xylanase inhibitor C-terminal domain-containing protein n=1 Tax=Nyssa sinensis TaxID=561372 RepID=A0A5J4ZU60_9ASTE|nr:hypothetical protein F0562_013316 [Nyssa sinensis]
MGSLFSLTLIVLSLASMKSEAQGIKSAPLLDLVIRDYTFRSYENYFRTGMLHTVHLPANLSGIRVNTVKFRCGSLRRYGARIKEFHLGSGVIVQHCVERVMVVRQNLGYNWSSIYYDNYELSGYQLVSPVLGLLAYNGGDDKNFSNPFELQIQAGKNPITIDFSNTTRFNTTAGLVPICASFDHDGKVTLANQVSPNVCVAMGQGHFGLVIESPLLPVKKKVKKKARMEEMERRAYEEEALEVSMVGHVRAPTAPVTRTLPAIEHEYEYRPPPLL